MLHYHRDIELNGEEVPKEYAKRHHCCLLLVNPFQED